MSINILLSHVTHYKYDRPVNLSPQIIRLRPAPHARTPILSYSLRVTPAEHFLNWQQDPQGNYLARLVFPEKTTEFKIEVNLVAEMVVINPFDFFLEPSAEKFPFGYSPEQEAELAPFLIKCELTPLLKRYVASIGREPMLTVDFLMDLNQGLQKDIAYGVRMEPGVQTPEETLTLGSGSCRDTGWLLVQILRHLGLAARFVSGYLVQLTPDIKSLDGPSGPAVDFTDLHAWCEVYLPGAGWVGLDPTSGLMAGEGHIPLACTPEPPSAAPVTGLSDPCETEFHHAMRVDRVLESPRVTKPYTDAQWAAVLALGEKVDADLHVQDVRLTMGGEPTFVSVDDPDGGEWNTEAMGPHKRGLSVTLLDKLRDHYAPHGLLHYGQGKWYPGEQLPRWALSCFWRKDGQPIWHNPKLYADEAVNYGFGPTEAARFGRALCSRLGISDQFLMPGFEDAFYYLWKERRLPLNVDPFDSNLADELERERLAKVFEQGLDHTVGYALPLANGGQGWSTGPWFLRSERMYLIPGDSPMGLRLPIDSQPWVSKAEYPYLYDVDPFEQRAPLPSPAHWQQVVTQRQLSAAEAARAQASTEGYRVPNAQQSASWITRTALCLQPRDGRIYLFMPPLAHVEQYLELVAAIEATAAAEALPVLLEGYEPPRDPRLDVIKVTPDPGVIEVNVQPAHSWAELVDNTTFLYDTAHQTRLTTEKFMLDGRHTGTGGGNHIVMGGATPADSPFLRRPDVLRSLVGYWMNHPSLSYLFSGMFIGPTSQAPRVDEARNDSVYELELAFRQFPELAQNTPPWLVDRLLRNLLIDSTGNTHRAEFCIDKLYSPDSSTGRLGLLELRAFEMPPHSRMSLTQQLLLRGLVSRFWDEPYQPPRLKRWGTELHDRFMLPHFVHEDFGDVLQELREHGYNFDDSWFDPHFEFRFPIYGDFNARGLQVELRQALEPWHVMGEEVGGGGTARYVDSSLERLQVKVHGLIDERHVLTCNGVAVPLHATGKVGEYVAGVRYRAWQPPSALHPTIPVHAPLVFDVVDTWMKRSLGGCAYHVSHPGGRAHEDYPVNSYAAEGRRLARFTRLMATPGRMEVEMPERNPNFPFTLDLRRGGD